MSEKIDGLFESTGAVKSARDRQSNHVHAEGLVTDGERVVTAYDPAYQICLMRSHRNDTGIALELIASVYDMDYAKDNLVVNGDGSFSAHGPGAEYAVEVYRYDTGLRSEAKKRLPTVWKSGLWHMDAYFVYGSGVRKLSVTRYFIVHKGCYLKMVRSGDLAVILDGARDGKRWRVPRKVPQFYKRSSGLTEESKRQTERLRRMVASGVLAI